MKNINRFFGMKPSSKSQTCLLYTSDAADEEDSVDLGGRRIIKKKNTLNDYFSFSLVLHQLLSAILKS